jgi:hypothetical protein
MSIGGSLIELEIARILGSVPEAEDLNSLRRLIDAIENQVGSKQHLLYSLAPVNVTAAVRQNAQRVGLIEKALSKSFRGSRIIRRDISANLLEIVQSERGKYYLVTHPGMRRRASSMDTPGPDSIDRMPASIASSISGVSSISEPESS